MGTMNHQRLSPPAVCVFCSSSVEVSAAVKDAGARAGAMLARHGLDLVYGGTTCGLMKITADAHKAAGGRLIGVVPDFMVDQGIRHPGLDEVVAVPDMRTRKARMLDRAGGFLVLPGGIGTFDEFFDILALKQLGKHRKPIVLLDTEGYYAPLVALMQHGVDRRTIREEHLKLFIVAATPEEAVTRLVGG